MTKKRYVFMTFLFLLLTSSLCFANKAVLGETSVGGLHVGYTYEDVVSIYGNSDKKEDFYSPLYAHEQVPVHTRCEWGDKLWVQFGDGYGGYKGHAAWITVTNKRDENNGIMTPLGVHVGMPFSKAKKIYGISSPAKWFYVLNPDRSTMMKITSTPNPVNGILRVRKIEVRLIMNDKDRADMERFLTQDK